MRKGIARVLTVYRANLRAALKSKIEEDGKNKKGKVRFFAVVFQGGGGAFSVLRQRLEWRSASVARGGCALCGARNAQAAAAAEEHAETQQCRAAAHEQQPQHGSSTDG